MLCGARVGQPLPPERVRRNAETDSDNDGIWWLFVVFVLSFLRSI